MKRIRKGLTLILSITLLPFFSLISPIQNAHATPGSGAFLVNPSPHESYVMPYGHLNITLSDLKFILDQIKFSEAHAARTSTTASQLQNNGNPSNTIIYPYDVTSINRCLTPDDLLKIGRAHV